MDKVCEACKTIPPIVDQDQYQEKGSYEDINGVNCYVAAPQPTPESGIIFIFDIFGFFKQTLQGADILALTDPGHVVVMPDFFFGKPMDIKKFPPQTDEDKAALGNFFKNEADLDKTKQTSLKVLEGLKTKYPSVKKWGIFGLCWGGKAATYTAKDKNGGFSACGQAHPAMLDPKDFDDFPVPHLCLSSKDEDTKVAEEVISILKSQKERNPIHAHSHSEIYKNNIHGWMGARANLKNDFERESFEKGYTQVVDFFKKTLG